MIRNTTFAVCIAIVLTASFHTVGRAATFTSPKGFSFDYPDGWQTATAEQKELLQEEVKKALNGPGGITLDQVAVFVCNPKNEDAAELAFVTIIQNTFTVSPKMLEGFKKGFVTSQEKQGAKMLKPLNIEQITISGRKAISARSSILLPDGKTPIENWQVLAPGRTQTYMITCISSDTKNSSSEAAFAKIINSFKVADPGVDSSNAEKDENAFSRSIGKLVGVVIVLVLFGAYKLTKVLGNRATSNENGE